MFVEVRIRNLELLPEFEAQCASRVQKALSRHAPGVRRVIVRIADVNGPRGGVDKLCRTTVVLAKGGRLVAEGRSDRIRPALAQALERVRTQLDRSTRKRSSTRAARERWATPLWPN